MPPLAEADVATVLRVFDETATPRRRWFASWRAARRMPASQVEKALEVLAAPYGGPGQREIDLIAYVMLLKNLRVPFRLHYRQVVPLAEVWERVHLRRTDLAAVADVLARERNWPRWLVWEPESG